MILQHPSLKHRGFSSFCADLSTASSRKLLCVLKTFQAPVRPGSLGGAAVCAALGSGLSPWAGLSLRNKGSTTLLQISLTCCGSFPSRQGVGKVKADCVAALCLVGCAWPSSHGSGSCTSAANNSSRVKWGGLRCPLWESRASPG